jgi:hypothetical protein
VARSIVFAAEHPRRDIFVGGGAKLFDILQRISPPLVDWLMTRGDKIFKDQISDRPAVNDNLFEPPHGPRQIRGPHPDQVHSTCHYTTIFEWHPALKPVAIAVAALGVAALVRGLAKPQPGPFERLSGKT